MEDINGSRGFKSLSFEVFLYVTVVGVRKCGVAWIETSNVALAVGPESASRLEKWWETCSLRPEKGKLVFSSGRTIGELSSMILWNIGHIINEYLKLVIEISRHATESGGWIFLDCYYKACETEMNLWRKCLVLKQNIEKNQEDSAYVWIGNKAVSHLMSAQKRLPK